MIISFIGISMGWLFGTPSLIQIYCEVGPGIFPFLDKMRRPFGKVGPIEYSMTVARHKAFCERAFVDAFALVSNTIAVQCFGESWYLLDL